MKWYKYDIRNLTSAEYTKWYALMSKDKRARVDCFRFADDKKRTVVGEMFARKAISDWCDVPTESIIFSKTETGKPYAKGLPVEFNISHSGDMVVCAVDDQPVGIDIEQIRPIDVKMIDYICCPDELKYIFQGNKDIDFTSSFHLEELLRFFEVWTAKEAYGKWSGVGIKNLRAENTRKMTGVISVIRECGYVISICSMKPPKTHS